MRDAQVRFPAQGLGPAQGVANPLPQHPGKEAAEQFVAQVVDELHRLFLHRVEEAVAVDELGFAAGEGVEEARQILGRDCQVREVPSADMAARLRNVRFPAIALDVGAGSSRCKRTGRPFSAGFQWRNLTPHVVPCRHTTWQRVVVLKPSDDRSKSEEKM